MTEHLQFIRVEFKRFKAFQAFSLHLRHFNIMVGPNNAGKSTILAAFRILAAGMRRANQWKPIALRGPTGFTKGYKVDLSAISVAEENLFYNYDDSEPASVTFTLSNRRQLQLYFPEAGSCYLIPNDPEKAVSGPAVFASRFNCPIGFVPILGPVEHNEPLFEKEAARLALFNYRAARNFRNIWYHYPEHFETFRRLLRETWPGMDIEQPKIDTSRERPALHMFCPEDRIPREIFWSGFGFQVWCQMLTHIVQAADRSLFLIDEPDIYLHSDLQRQLLGLLRNLGPDILIATHSTEMITEAEPDDIVVIDKTRSKARRISNPSELGDVFMALGSNLNPILTQLAKTRRAVFVEGKDFQILGKLAHRLGLVDVGGRRTFAVVPVEGFNPERIRSLKKGIETTLGTPIAAAAVFDKDYRSRDECTAIVKECETFCDLAIIHDCKEVENLLLAPAALDRAAGRRVADRAKRGGVVAQYTPQAAALLDEFAAEKRSYVISQYLAARRRFARSHGSSVDEASISQAALDEFEVEWSRNTRRYELMPGKEALAFVNARLQAGHSISVTTSGIIDAFAVAEIASGARGLLARLDQFATGKSGSG